MPLASFYTPLKHLQISGFQRRLKETSGLVKKNERDQWLKTESMRINPNLQIPTRIRIPLNSILSWHLPAQI